MTVYYLSDYKTKNKPHAPREISFYGHMYTRPNGEQHTVSIHIRIEDGDVEGILSTVIQRGGIGQDQEDGTYAFIPWPCAAVEIRDL